MKIENMRDAAKAAEEYERALKNLKWAEDSTYFSAACGPAKDSTIKTTDDVRLDHTMYSGDLANALRTAIIAYKKGMVELCAARLRALGVEVPMLTN